LSEHGDVIETQTIKIVPLDFFSKRPCAPSIFILALHPRRIVGAAALGGLGIPYDFQQLKVLLAPHLVFFGHTVQNYGLLNTVMASFNNIMGQMTEISQQKKPRLSHQDVTKPGPRCHLVLCRTLEWIPTYQ